MNLNTSRIALCSIMSCTLVQCASAQSRTALPTPPASPPPTDTPGNNTTVSGKISQFNYNRDGEIDGFLLDGKAFVHLPPRFATRVESSMHRGDSVQATGIGNASPEGIQQFDAVALQDKTSGRSFGSQINSATSIAAMTGRIEFLNYDRRGAINGFLLDNGTLVRMPAVDPANASRLQVGASVSLSGDRSETASERKIVDAQTLTVNGQPFAIAQAPPPPPRHGALGRNRRSALPRVDGPVGPPPPPPAEAPRP